MKRTAYFLFGLLLLGSYLRLFFSVGLLGYMDESYWVASSLLSTLGGTPYVNELYVQQNAGLLFEPFTALYYKLFDVSGVVLFVRHLYFILACVCSWLWFREWRGRVDDVTALALASLPLVGTWWAEPSLGYNAIGCLGFGTGMLLALRGLESRSLCSVFASGVFFALALSAYPSLLGAFLLFWLLALLASREWKLALLGLASAACLVAAFLLSLIARAGLENLRFAYAFTTAQSSLGSFSGKLGYGLQLWLAFLPPVWIWLPLFVAWLYGWWKHHWPWQIFAVVMCVCMLLKTPPEDGPFHSQLVLLLALSGLPLVVRSDWACKVMYATGLAGALLTCWTSALTVYTTYVTATWCLAAVYVSAKPRTARVALLTFAIPLTVFFNRTFHHAFDDGTHEFEMFTSGPSAGLLTSAARYAFLNQVERDVETAARDGAQSILFYPDFPLGYLFAPLRPATQTMFLHGLRESGPAIQQQYRLYYTDPAVRPDVLVRFNSFTADGRVHSQDPAQYSGAEDVFWNYLPSEAEYAPVVVRESYSVYRRKH